MSTEQTTQTDKIDSLDDVEPLPDAPTVGFEIRTIDDTKKTAAVSDDVETLRKALVETQAEVEKTKVAGLLDQIRAVDPKLAEKHKGKSASELELVLDVASSIRPGKLKAFTGTQEAEPVQTMPSHPGYRDPISGEWVN